MKGNNMTKIIILPLVASVLFFTGCNEETKKEVSDASSAVSTSVKEKTAETVDMGVEAKDNIAEKAADTIDATKDNINP